MDSVVWELDRAQWNWIVYVLISRPHLGGLPHWVLHGYRLKSSESVSCACQEADADVTWDVGCEC